MERNSNIIRVLFVCVYNSARGQMAEAYLRKFGNKGFVVEVMEEEGIDLPATLRRLRGLGRISSRQYEESVTKFDSGFFPFWNPPPEGSPQETSRRKVF
jgi:hypothetical protein